MACSLRRSLQKKCSSLRSSSGGGKCGWHRCAKSRGSSLWSQTSQDASPPFVYQPTSMTWWLRTFRGLGGQVDREVQQMVALQLGVLEQYKRWNRADQHQLEDAIPEI